MSPHTNPPPSQNNGGHEEPKIKHPSVIARLLTNSITDPLEAALAYLMLDWRPIPVTPRGKKPLIESWAEFQDKAPTEEQVRDWFTRWPDANVAVLTGHGSGIVAVDLDSREGESAFRALCGDVRTLANLTGNGRHVIFQHPAFPV